MSEIEKDISEFEIPGQYRYENMLLSPNFPCELIEKTINFPLQESDTVLSSYLKTGTNLLAETIWLLQHDADVETAKHVPNYYRIPLIYKTGMKLPMPIEELFATLSHPRTVRMHFPAQYWPKSVQNGISKCVYILRNPKDTLVSFYHHHRAVSVMGNFSGTWDEFFHYFQRNEYTLLFGNPVDHMLSYWKRRNLPNVHIVFYEDLVMEKEKTVRKIDQFLGTNLNDEKIATVCAATNFESMKSLIKDFKTDDKVKQSQTGEAYYSDPKICPYMRKGKIGDWKNYFNEEQNRIMDDMCEKKLAGTGLSFFYG